MSRYVAFLRGINVGGINIKMADLTRTFEALGFTDVKTILASGNVRFTTSKKNSPALKREVESALTERFGYEAWVIILDIATVVDIIRGYPFGEDDVSKQPWVMFLGDPSVRDDLLSVAGDLDPSVERLEPSDGVIYWEVTKEETVNSVFGKHNSKARFKPHITTRNLRTLRKTLP